LSTAIFGGLAAAFITKWTKMSQSFIAASGTLAEETISTIRTTKAFGMQDTLAGMYEKHLEDGRRVDLKGALLQGVGFGVAIFIIYAADSLGTAIYLLLSVGTDLQCIAFWYGSRLVLQGKADIAVIVTVFMALLMGSFSIAVAAPHIQAVVQGIGAAGKLFATIDRVPLIDALSEEGLTPNVEDIQGEIKFENVNFEYPARKDVKIFNGLNVLFEKGKTTAIVGPSGSGKSTTVALIERFYDPTAGAIFLDGVDLRELNVGWVRRQIGLVSQEPVLFSASIRENVLMGLEGTGLLEGLSEEKKDEMVKDACIVANADNFVRGLAKGYDTIVGERGYLMSGGQKRTCISSRK
jgi:ATP-binding cassette subfamily B (MDR/TAP) protein 1